MVNEVQEISDQLPGVETCPVPNDENAFGLWVFFFQKPAQEVDGIFHVGPIELLEVELQADQIQGPIESSAVPLVHHRHLHPLPLFAPNIAC